MTVEHGLIVLGDVSGYTEFIATTELEILFFYPSAGGRAPALHVIESD